MRELSRIQELHVVVYGGGWRRGGNGSNSDADGGSGDMTETVAAMVNICLYTNVSSVII